MSLFVFSENFEGKMAIFNTVRRGF